MAYTTQIKRQQQAVDCDQDKELKVNLKQLLPYYFKTEYEIKFKQYIIYFFYRSFSGHRSQSKIY